MQKIHKMGKGANDHVTVITAKTTKKSHPHDVVGDVFEVTLESATWDEMLDLIDAASKELRASGPPVPTKS